MVFLAATLPARGVRPCVRFARIEFAAQVGALAHEYAAAANGVPTRLVGDPSEATEALRGLLRPGDVVLVKGSRAAGLEAVAANLRN